MSQNLSQLASSPFRSVVSGDSPVTVAPSNQFFKCSAGAGDIIANLPSLTNARGRLFTFLVLDVADNIVITPAGGETINGAANFTQGAGAGDNSVIVYAPLTGVDWWVVGYGETT